jgi:Leucine-rich repeat (LRR) protein
MTKSWFCSVWLFDMMRNRPDGEDARGGGYSIEISRERAVVWVKPRIRGFQNAEAQKCTADEVLDYLIERTSLLREPASGLIDFPHRTFQEYFAACAAGAEGQEDFLAKQSSDDQWHETIMIAAGTTTGGVRFGHSLIDALLKRAGRHKSARKSSLEVRKTCFALALGCLENLRQHEPELRNRVIANLGELVPPRNAVDARILSVAGDAAVSYLSYDKWKGEDEATVAACTQALRMINTAAACRTLEQGYVKDTRYRVLAEISECRQIRLANVPAIADGVLKSGYLPHFAEIRDINQLIGLLGFKSLALNAEVMKNLEKISLLNDLEVLTISKVAASQLSNICWPGKLRSINLIHLKSDDLGWVGNLPSLKSLQIGIGDLDSIKFVNRLDELENLSLASVGVSDFTPISACKSLRTISFDDCSLSNLSFLDGLTQVEGLQFVDCEKLARVEPICLVNSLQYLGIVECRNIEDYSSLANMTGLKTLYLSGTDKIKSLDALKALNTLGDLRLENLSDLCDLSGLPNLPRLSRLIVDGCPAVQEIPHILSLERLTLRGLPMLKNLDAARSASRLNALYIDDCRNLGDLGAIGELTALKGLAVSRLSKMKDLSNLERLHALEYLELVDCVSITSLSQISLLQNLEFLVISDCQNLRDVSVVSNLKKLKYLALVGSTPVPDLAFLTNGNHMLEEIRIDVREWDGLTLPDELASRVRPGANYSRVRDDDKKRYFPLDSYEGNPRFFRFADGEGAWV